MVVIIIGVSVDLKNPIVTASRAFYLPIQREFAPLIHMLETLYFVHASVARTVRICDARLLSHFLLQITIVIQEL